MQVNTFAPNAFTRTPAQAVTHLNTLPSTNRVLVLTQQDMQTALADGTTAIPDTIEDWLALLLYYAIDKTTNTANADRRFRATNQGLGLDTGAYQSGKIFYVRSVTTSFYSEAISLSGKPSLGDF